MSQIEKAGLAFRTIWRQGFAALTECRLRFMPLKNGKLTTVERRIATSMVMHGSPEHTAAKIGITDRGVRKALERPAVQAEIARQQQELLFREILPLAVAAHKRLLTDPRTPAGAVATAVKIAYDRTLGADDARQGKEPHEMTGEELAEAISTLERIAAERAKPVHQLEGSTIVNDLEEVDVFG